MLEAPRSGSPWEHEVQAARGGNAPLPRALTASAAWLMVPQILCRLFPGVDAEVIARGAKKASVVGHPWPLWLHAIDWARLEGVSRMHCDIVMSEMDFCMWALSVYCIESADETSDEVDSVEVLS